MTVVFKSTSGDSAVIETMFPGSNHEMINMYHEDGDAVVLTHYCMLGNQPHMKLMSNDNGVLKFEFAGATNLKSQQEPHMGSVELTIKGDRLSEKWGFYKDGKLEKYETFEFKRQG